MGGNGPERWEQIKLTPFAGDQWYYLSILENTVNDGKHNETLDERFETKHINFVEPVFNRQEKYSPGKACSPNIPNRARTVTVWPRASGYLGQRKETQARNNRLNSNLKYAIGIKCSKNTPFPRKTGATQQPVTHFCNQYVYPFCWWPSQIAHWKQNIEWISSICDILKLK